MHTDTEACLLHAVHEMELEHSAGEEPYEMRSKGQAGPTLGASR